MNAMPSEVTDLIVSQITSKKILRNVRLVSKSLSTPATRELFSKQYISLPVLDEHSTQLTRLQNIASSPTLAAAVRNLTYTTSLNPNKTIRAYRNNEASSIFSDPMAEAIQLVNRFSNLSSLRVEFACVCAFIAPDDYYTMEAEESILFRTMVLKSIFTALNDPAHPTTALRSLSFKNLQNINDEELVNSENFLHVLARLSDLRLKITSQVDEASPENSWRHAELFAFFAQLPKTWLKPARHHLTSLTLHSNDFWGYVPKADFRSVHFPKLKRLELGNYTFTHGWQLQWILAHGQTLEELVLDDCPIIRRVTIGEQLDKENYPANPPSMSGEARKWRYDSRWADYFRKMEEGLLKLWSFKFGYGNWTGGLNFDEEESFQIGTHSNMYMDFNDRIGPSPWIEEWWKGDESDDEDSDDEDSDDKDSDDEGDSEHKDFIDLEVGDVELEIIAAEEGRDYAAYASLMATLAKRR